jgi:hypothetical protein
VGLTGCFSFWTRNGQQDARVRFLRVRKRSLHKLEPLAFAHGSLPASREIGRAACRLYASSLSSRAEQYARLLPAANDGHLTEPW